jgi:hypothetical protein
MDDHTKPEPSPPVPADSFDPDACPDDPDARQRYFSEQRRVTLRRRDEPVPAPPALPDDRD